MTGDDQELVQTYAAHGSDEAFRVLVERHAGMVRATALRMVLDASMAEEIAQGVFILLARKASTLPRETIVAGWLYQTTRFIAHGMLRSEKRRQQRDQVYADMNQNQSPESSSVWQQVQPHLDDALAELGATDRDSLVLRFLEGRSFAEVGAALGTTEPAAKMRVSRAVARLGRALGQRGVVVSAAALTVSLSAAAAAPVSAAAASQITAAGLAGVASSTLGPILSEVLKFMALQKLKLSLLIGAAVLLMAGGVTGLLLLAWHLHGPRSSHARQMAQPATALVGFAPMAGEWEGTWSTRSDGQRATRPQRVILVIEAPGDGRVCRIQMQPLDRNDRPTAQFRFEHALNTAGDRIRTTQDGELGPSVLDGEVTEAFHDQSTGEWHLGFRATSGESNDKTECRWERVRDELLIHREDVANAADGPQTQVSELNLRPRSNKPRTALGALPRGKQNFDGVSFMVERPINIIGARAARAKGSAPARVADPTVQGHGRSIHVLHTGDHGTSATGDYIWRLVLHYADGARESFDFAYDLHLRNFWRRSGDGPPAPTDPDSSLAWVGASQESDRSSAELVITRTSLRNPRPATAVTGAEYVSLFGPSSAYVLGVTVSDNGPIPVAAERPSAPRIVPVTFQLTDSAGHREADASVEFEYFGDDFVARPTTYVVESDGRVRLFIPAGIVFSISYSALAADGKFASGLIDVDPDRTAALEEAIVLGNE